MRLRQIAVNGSGGAFVDIYATVPCRSFEFIEDEGAATQGIDAKLCIDNFATTNRYSFATQQAGHGEVPNFHKVGLEGRILGLPEQGVNGAFNYRAADKLMSVRSATATATTLRFIEYEE